MIQDMNISNSVSTAISNQATQLLKYKVNSETKYGYIMPIGETGFIALSCIPKGQYFSSLVLATAAQTMAENTETQAAAIEELFATATTVADQVKENRDNSEKSATYTNEVADVMEQSKTQMAQMREAMDKIQETAQMADVQMKNIDQIRDVIDDMSQVVRITPLWQRKLPQPVRN